MELRHRRRARSEAFIRDTKASGLATLPFDGVANDGVANDGVWMQLCLAANDLLAWGRRISLDGAMQPRHPKTIRSAQQKPRRCADDTGCSRSHGVESSSAFGCWAHRQRTRRNGSSFNGDGVKALHDLADAYHSQLHSTASQARTA
ncbi:MAG TPA: hypothetical protein VEK09_01810 [Jatrophihabitantaceae bacterium]|nr:hypothetical protein [Jatrophihabitantaceae bacterium]